MAEDGKGIALVILGIVAIVAVIGLVLLFSGAKMGGAAMKEATGATHVGCNHDGICGNQRNECPSDCRGGGPPRLECFDEGFGIVNFPGGSCATIQNCRQRCGFETAVENGAPLSLGGFPRFLCACRLRA